MSRRDDQWFSVGDKVVRVAGENDPRAVVCEFGCPKSGKVYCVSDFYEGPQFNAVMFVGFGTFGVHECGTLIGFRASCFRKVDEIALCVKAARQIEQPEEQGAAR